EWPRVNGTASAAPSDPLSKSQISDFKFEMPGRTPGLRLVGLDHGQPSAAAVPPDAVHVGLDEEDAAAAALLEVFVGRGVGHAAAVEAGALVLDADLDLLGADLRLDVDLLVRVEPVAVLDRVDHRLLERELDGKEAVAVESLALQRVEDL